MKLTEIAIENILGVRHLNATLTAPIGLFVGPNDAGKSSAFEAVCMGFLGAPRFDILKKEYAALVSDGAKAGHARVETADCGGGDFLLPKGVHGQGLTVNKDLLRFVLDAQSFARLALSDRRKFILNLSGQKLSANEVEKRLMAKGFDAERVKVVKADLPGGFEAARNAAKTRASEARGAWKSITGETYGEIKAEGWTAPPPEAVDDSRLVALQCDVNDYREAITGAQQKIGAAEALKTNAAQRTHLQEKADKIDRITQKLAVDQKILAQTQEQIAELETKVGVRKDPHACPHCSGLVEVQQKAGIVLGLIAFEAQTYDPEAARAIERMKPTLESLKRTITNDERDLADANAAADLLKSLGTPIQAGQDTEVLKQQINQWTDEKAKLEGEIRAIEDAQRQAAQAATNTAKAAGQHDLVRAWTAIADALAPEGIPSEMLAEALVPINKRLLNSAHLTGWPVVQISSDVEITVAGRRYGAPFTCESNNWRADAMIAEAIAHLSGLKFVALDRFDVLDLKGRSELIGWLDELAYAGELDTALLFGTMKAIPAGLPDTCQAVWLENGKSVDLAKAA
jgi:hypothetical protein